MNDSGLALSTYIDEYNQYLGDLKAENYTGHDLPFLIAEIMLAVDEAGEDSRMMMDVRLCKLPW